MWSGRQLLVTVTCEACACSAFILWLNVMETCSGLTWNLLKSGRLVGLDDLELLLAGRRINSHCVANRATYDRSADGRTAGHLP